MRYLFTILSRWPTPERRITCGFRSRPRRHADMLSVSIDQSAKCQSRHRQANRPPGWDRSAHGGDVPSVDRTVLRGRGVGHRTHDSAPILAALRPLPPRR